MSRLVLENVAKDYTGPRGQCFGAVKNLNLVVADGEFLVIVGPSGCGKTTTLRLIAGLETPDRGTISLAGLSLAGVPPKDRDLAMVFQDHALFPHLNVFENMAFGLMLRKFPRAEIETRVNAAAEMLHLTSLLKRRPTELSGGECQRAALGRALVRQPKIFLLDEPLSNLDAPMRMQLRGEIAALRRQLGATMIFVTHDQAEAMALADRIVVMHDGLVQQIASPTEIYQRPANRFVAGFIGSPPMNFFNGTIAQHNGNVCFEHDEGLSIQIDEDRAKALRNFVGKPMTLGLRPEHIQAVGQGNGAGVVNARLERIESTGPESHCYFSHHNLALVSRVETGFRGTVGEAVPLRIETCQAHFFETDSGTRVGV